MAGIPLEGVSNFDGTVTLFYLCNLDPVDPDTSQFMAVANISIQVIDVIPDECGNDDNNNGICDEQEQSFCGSGTQLNVSEGVCEAIPICGGDLNEDGPYQCCGFAAVPSLDEYRLPFRG